MLHGLLFMLSSLVRPASAELNPADDEPGFRIYDIMSTSSAGGSGLLPKSGASAPKAGDVEDGLVEVARDRAGKRADATQSEVLLRGKLMVVGKDPITVGGVTWAAGSNYWFWGRSPVKLGGDPCDGEALRMMPQPGALESFAIRLAVDGTGKAPTPSFAKDGSLPGTSCRPEHAARGPSRVFDDNANYMMRTSLGDSRGTLYRMELVSKGGRQSLGYAYHDPAAPDFGDPARFGWFLETHTSPDTTRPLSQLPTPIASASRSTYARKGDAPRGMIDLDPDEILVFTMQAERPDSVTGVNTIDLLVRKE